MSKTPFVETEVIVDAVLSHALTERDLERIAEAVKTRQRAIDSLKIAQLKPGDVVRLKEIRPKYLTGTRTTVVRLSSTGKHVYVDGAALGPRFRKECKVSLQCIAVEKAV
jgi:NMD protein affecting ribosome stability and mRNA decay